VRRFESFIALRYLRSKRKEVFISIISVISVLGVAISVMVLNIVLSVMTGFEAELRDKLIGATAHLIVRSYNGPIENYTELTEKIAGVPGVVSAFPYTQDQAMLSTPAGSRGVIIRGVADTPTARMKIDQYMSADNNSAQLFSPVEYAVQRPDGVRDIVKLPPLIVGQELLRRMALVPGTPVTIFSPELSSSPQGLIPKQRRFVTTGAYSSGLVEYEGGVVYTSLEAAQSFFGSRDAVTGIEVDLEDLFKAKELGARIAEVLGGIDSQFFITDWIDMNRPLWKAIELERRVYFIVLLLLILVASFSIVSTLVMVVMEKTKDIAILKSMGATDSSILRIFLVQGSLIGIVGTIVGTLLGVLGCVGLREFGFEIDQAVFSLDKVPVHMLPENFATVAVAAFFITSLAGIYPAVRAARLKPADAFRFD